ncbi:MAG: EAL domain-containing protein [Sideroxyarcus sp.]|nr:EAL domain-containing protein [Sideroxyarcus sp.]
MSNKRGTSDSLRSAAEARVARRPLSSPFPLSAEKLLHELQVHQVELEMQNEALRVSQAAMELSRDRYADLFEFAPVGYVTISAQAMIAEINLTACELLGLERSKLVNCRFSKFVSEQDSGRWRMMFHKMLKQTETADQTFDLEMTRADGSIFFAHLVCLRREITDVQSLLRIALVDITKLKIAEAKLRIASTVFESQEGMLVTDAEGLIIAVNASFSGITGYSAEEVIGKNPSLLSSGRHDAAFYAAMWDSLKRLGFWEGDIWNKRKNGEVYPEHLIITVVNDQNGKIQNYVATLTDITMSRSAADEIRLLAFYDQLTGLPNRRLLLDRLKLALASSSRNGKEGGILFLDLDNFKTLNDTLGHDIGDQLLQQVARRIESCVREGDTVARLGGDEFVVMLEDLSEQPLEAAEQVEAVGKKILARLNQTFQLATHEYRMSVSIGATLFQNHQTGLDDLFRQADIAMYQAKKEGRNTLRFFDPLMQASIYARATLEAQLRDAIEHGQFQLYFQVQVDSSRRALGAEALLRWLHPERGIVLPVHFVPLAEETGLILPIGNWVLETACALLKVWQDDASTRNLTLSVNVSARQFHEAGFVARVQEAMQRHGINPGLLKLEPTESILLENLDATVATMNALKTIGVSFALDDFGTGFSSLQYLKKLPLNQLKIDQSFVRDLASDNSDQAIVRTIIAMAQSLSLEVIAEGVETEEQRGMLQESGCMHFQGYLFGRPVPIAEFEALLAKG